MRFSTLALSQPRDLAQYSTLVQNSVNNEVLQFQSHYPPGAQQEEGEAGGGAGGPDLPLHQGGAGVHDTAASHGLSPCWTEAR